VLALFASPARAQAPIVYVVSGPPAGTLPTALLRQINPDGTGQGA
jgi:hypothetical protein